MGEAGVAAYWLAKNSVPVPLGHSWSVVADEAGKQHLVGGCQGWPKRGQRGVGQDGHQCGKEAWSL